MVNKKMLKSKMALHDDTITSLSKAIGISRIPLSNKLNGKVEFTRKEIASITERYKLSPKEVCDIFGLKEG